MSEERRQDPRSRLAGVHATYESATGERHKTQVFDLGRGGLFLRTERPVTVGKRLSVEIAVTGESVTWEALGRVVWTREADVDSDHPAGMALKLIDMDDGVSERLERLVRMREATELGIGAPALGVIDDAPAVRPETAPHPRPVGVGSSVPISRPPAESAVAIELRVRRPAAGASTPPLADEEGFSAPAHPGAGASTRSVAGSAPALAGEEDPSVPARLGFDDEDVPVPPPTRRRGLTSTVLMLLVVAAAAAAYVWRDRLAPGQDLSAPHSSRR